MAKKTYIGVNNLARKVKKMYIGVTQTSENYIEYIESSGTQYIDTGVTSSDNIKIEIKAEILDLSKNAAIFGGKSSSGEIFRIIYNSETDKFTAGYRTSGDIVIPDTIVSSGVHTFLLDKTCFKIDDKLISISDETSFSSTNTINLFRINSKFVNHISTMRLFYCKIYENNILIRDFIPYKNSDGEIGLFDIVNHLFYKSLSEDSFIAGSNLASSGVARRIKKGYIGIGGVARPFLITDFTRFGLTESPLNNKSEGLSAAATSEYAFFAGGADKTENSSAFNKTLTLFNPPSLSVNVKHLSANALDEKAYFAGGVKDNGYFENIVEFYDNSLVKSSLTKLSESRSYLASAVIGDYILFAGGRALKSGYLSELGSKTVDSYSKSGTKLNLELSQKRYGLVGVTVGNYALFAGGLYVGTDIPDCFDSSLTRNLNATEMLVNYKFYAAATSVGDYAIIVGGKSTPKEDLLSSDIYGNAEIYNSSLTRVSTISIGIKACDLAATSLGEYAVFAGGNSDAGYYDAVEPCKYVNYFDSSLTLKVADNLLYARQKHAGVTIGNYALFGGGTHNTVEVYTS